MAFCVGKEETLLGPVSHERNGRGRRGREEKVSLWILGVSDEGGRAVPRLSADCTHPHLP